MTEQQSQISAAANGTYVNGQRIDKTTELQPGAVIDIGPFSLGFDGVRLTSRSRANNVRLDVNQVSYVVADQNTNRQLHLLNDVTFHISPGQFVAILGPSGSGKSTLLKVASGREWPFAGSVALNDRDLHRQFAALKEDLVVVPQTAAFHQTLSVQQTVQFAASLRLPPDTDDTEIQSIVAATLQRVGLSDRNASKVDALSGGQLKRLGLACELISDPSLLFLDEVTSGLDEQGDREMMRLFRQLADSGKTLVCVTHNLSNIIDCCHQVLVLTPGGRVAFFGPPEDACEHFGVKQLADIYSAMDTRSPQELNALFLNSKFFNSVPTISVAQPNELRNQSSLIHRIGRKPLSQAIVLTKRYVLVWLGDKAALLAMFGQAVLVTVLLCLVFDSIPASDVTEELMRRKTEIRNLLFLISVSCFWLGANNAAKEIVRERQIYERERNFNLVPEAFWASKVIVLSIIGFLQASFLTATVVLWCGLPGNCWALVAASVCLSFLGTQLGLAISANSKSEALAVALIPAVVIPQIVLAGVVASLSGFALLLAKWLTTSFWGQRLFENLMPEADRIPADFEPETVACLSVLAAQLIAYSLATWLGLRFIRQKRE